MRNENYLEPYLAYQLRNFGITITGSENSTSTVNIFANAQPHGSNLCTDHSPDANTEANIGPPNSIPNNLPQIESHYISLYRIPAQSTVHPSQPPAILSVPMTYFRLKVCTPSPFGGRNRKDNQPKPRNKAPMPGTVFLARHYPSHANNIWTEHFDRAKPRSTLN